MVSLYDFMLAPFKYNGHCVVMDSAYMGDAMCQVGREEWFINMVGTVQLSRSGAGALAKLAIKAGDVKKGTHESLLYQHKTKPLVFAVWADNNFVRTLSNFHSPSIVQGRMKRNEVTGKREREQSEVDCNEQQTDYCSFYHWIDKGNGQEAKYDLSCESHIHGWPPKLKLRLYNSNSNNTYKYYTVLYNMCHPGQIPMPILNCIHNLTHSNLQRGEDIRQRGPGVPPSATKDITSTTSGDGRKVRSDSARQGFISPTNAHGSGAIAPGTPQTLISGLTARGLYHQQAAFRALKRRQPGRNHQSVPMVVKDSGKECRYIKCPGFNTSKKRKRPYTTIYKCEQCSIDRGTDFWLCHTTKKINGEEIVVDCHTKYHVENNSFVIGGTECTPVSDLTEEGTDPPNNNIDSV
jgi:hypothetical protein